MAERKHQFSVGEYYHLYSRGVEKRKIFLRREDYERFLLLLYVCNTEKNIKLRDIGKNFERGETVVDIGAYCLMPNHIHILIKEKQEGGISKYMLKVLTAYSMYFNTKYERSGALFGGTFKSIHCLDDNYLKYIYSYIHLNPAKIIDKNWRKSHSRGALELLKYISDYKYSSWQEYLYKSHITNPEAFPQYFTQPEDHRRELFEWLSYQDTQENPV